MNIKVIVFDLDDTLLDTSKLLIPVAGTPDFFARIQQPLPTMEGAEENLKRLASKYDLALITQGNVKVQRQKLMSLALEHFFKKSYFVDSGAQENKQIYFQKILQDFQILPAQMLSVGNRRSTDIRGAKSLGAKTCLLRYGEHQNEAPEVAEDVPDYEIRNHQELIAVCKL